MRIQEANQTLGPIKKIEFLGIIFLLICHKIFMHKSSSITFL